MDLERFRKIQDEYLTAIRTEGEDLVKKLLAEFFNENPKVTAVTWCQYTPGYNDGDPCTFSLGEVNFRIGGEPLTEEMAEILDSHPADEEPAEGDTGTWVGTYSDAAEYKGCKTACKALADEIEGLEDLMEAAFGDGQQIVATPAGVFLNEYSCGY